MKSRLFWICQYVFHPKNDYEVNNAGELELKLGSVPIFSIDNIFAGLSHKSIKQYHYILHDKDVYSEEDERNDVNKIIKKGMKKPPHYHVALKCDNAVELESVARWFGVGENYIDVPKGRGAFYDCVRYHTHESQKEQAKGKHLYQDDECRSNFAWRVALAKQDAMKAKLGKTRGNVDIKDAIRYEVLYEGRTLRSVIEEDPMAYQSDMTVLDKFRLKYISTMATPPTTRINYYVTGQGGVGKGIISRALARSLYPDVENDDDIFFEVGAKNVPFEGYDGQPVIIWNDRRSYDLLDELGSRGNVFDVFDTHPRRGKQNVKYGSISLVNTYNIVNSVEDYTTFLDGLAGEYTDRSGTLHRVEDKAQSRRRFPFIIPLHESDFDILMNKGFYEGTREYEQYIEYRNIRGNMQVIREACVGNEKLARQIETMTLSPVKYLHDDMMKKHNSKPMQSEAEILASFQQMGYGLQPNQTYVKTGDEKY